MKNDKMKNQYRVNEQIRVREVRIVSDGESTVMPTRHALDMAREQGVDLVEISPNAQPPVCRLIDYFCDKAIFFKALAAFISGCKVSHFNLVDKIFILFFAPYPMIFFILTCFSACF